MDASRSMPSRLNCVGWLEALVRGGGAAWPGALALPALAAVGEPIKAGVAEVTIVLVTAAGAAVIGLALTPREGGWRLGPYLLVILSCWLLPWASFSGSVLVGGGLLGFGGAGLLDRRSADPVAIPGVLVLGGGLVVMRAVGDIEGAAWLVALVASLRLCDITLQASGPGQTRARRGGRRAAPAALAALFAVGWVGANSPHVTWFGDLTWHGNRQTPEVALTFDDGPNGETTLAVARILEEHGARGTFFLVGKAVAKQPEVARALLAQGHTIGNHSFQHDAGSFLDPGYVELDRADTAIKAATGICPAFFRPPHGTHTPFMSFKADGDDMTLVTWDVSAKDWEETDPARLARNILADVRPGSIILLHDGGDGIPGADRSVLLQALPAILDGLKARGLEPVTLDVLLQTAKANPASDC